MTKFDPAKMFMGNPCARGHDGMRYRCNGACVACTLEAPARKKAAALTKGAQPAQPKDESYGGTD